MTATQYERFMGDPINRRNTNIIPTGNVFFVKAIVKGTDAATAANYGKFWIAPYKCKVIAISEVHKTLGTDSGAVTLSVEKLNSTDALDGGDELLGATKFNLKSANNTVQNATLTTTTASLLMNAGDRLALVDTGVLTAVADVEVTVALRWQKQ